MDISTITDIKELKALAYDQLVIKETAERNLQAINQRIAQLAEELETGAPTIDSSDIADTAKSVKR